MNSASPPRVSGANTLVLSPCLELARARAGSQLITCMYWSIALMSGGLAHANYPPLPGACAGACAVPTYPALSPKFAPRWRMNESTIIMPCNAGESNGGWYNASFGASFGIVDYDWSNAKAYWSKAKPQDCQERLVKQAAMTKAANPRAKVWIYRNLVRLMCNCLWVHLAFGRLKHCHGSVMCAPKSTVRSHTTAN